MNDIREVIKSNGEVVPFDPEKLNKKVRWCADRKVEWSSLSLKVFKRLHNKCKTTDIDKAIIAVCNEEFDEKHFKLAGRVLAGTIYKEAFGGFKKIPSVKEHHDNMLTKGYWEDLSKFYTEEDFNKLEEAIDHTKDLRMSYPAIKQIKDKYVLCDRVAGRVLESPQFMYMGMAMAIMQNMDKSRRLNDVIKYYQYLSDNKICSPTPFNTQLRTPNRSFASCAVYTTDDTADSLNAGDVIAYQLTCASAGIGSHIKSRSQGDPVRGGTVVHQGKRPYYKHLETAVAANLQSSRGGSATQYVSCLDPEIMNILTWKSKKTPATVRVDGIHYNFSFNKFFLEKIIKKEEWMLISYYHAPDLHEAMYLSDDDQEFVRLYNKYLSSDKPKTMIKATELTIQSLVEGVESGQIYCFNSTEVNYHTPHKNKIYSSNLCCETAFPTVAFDNVYQLNESNPVNADGTTPEIGLCSLSAIVAGNTSMGEWGDVAYYAALGIDNVMEIMDYPFKSLEYTAKMRRNIGVGITNVAGLMALEGLKYSSLEGKQFLHRLFEHHAFCMIKSGVRLAKEFGACGWIHKTKWKDGWLPVDTMNKNVYKKIKQKLVHDWEGLRKEVKKHGVRFSVMVNYMPNESSSVATNGTNSILPARSLKVIKTNASHITRFLVPNADTHADNYELAWDISLEDMIDVYAICQTMCDQSISADWYLDLKTRDYTAEDLLKAFVYMFLMGCKTRYYINSRTNSGADPKLANTEDASKATDIEEVEDVGCAGGGCAL